VAHRAPHRHAGPQPPATRGQHPVLMRRLHARLSLVYFIAGARGLLDGHRHTSSWPRPSARPTTLPLSGAAERHWQLPPTVVVHHHPAPDGPPQAPTRSPTSLCGGPSPSADAPVVAPAG
jgi:hypothetical protein